MSQETIGLGSAKSHIFVMGAKINNNITSYYYVCSHNFSNIAFQTFISYIVIVYPLVSSAQQIMIAKNALVSGFNFRQHFRHVGRGISRVRVVKEKFILTRVRGMFRKNEYTNRIEAYKYFFRSTSSYVF